MVHVADTSCQVRGFQWGQQRRTRTSLATIPSSLCRCACQDTNHHTSCAAVCVLAAKGAYDHGPPHHACPRIPHQVCATRVTDHRQYCLRGREDSDLYQSCYEIHERLPT